MSDAGRTDGLRAIAGRVVPGGGLRRAWDPKGGVSATITALEVDEPGGGTVRLVVRRHGERDLAANPRLARDEFRLMGLARAHGLAVPRPYLCDESRTLLPGPFLVVEFIDGEPDQAPADLPGWLDQAAAHLAAIHWVEASPELAFIPCHPAGPGEAGAETDEALGEGRIRAALAATGGPAGRNEPTLLHGDYWPGNLLWRGGELVGVIDWEDARTGDPLADVANARLEILWAFGCEAMEGFTDRYRGRARSDLDWSGLASWDLIAALRPCGTLSGWGLGPEAEARMRQRHARFVERAIAGIARQ